MDFLKNFELGHIGLIVEDVDASVTMFEQLVGIDDFVVYSLEPTEAYAYGKELKCKMKIALGTFKGGVKLEIIQPLFGDIPHKRFLEECGPGIHHINFYTTEYDKCKQHFEAKNVPITFEARIVDDRGDRRSIYFEDKKMGCVIEFSEPSGDLL